MMNALHIVLALMFTITADNVAGAPAEQAATSLPTVVAPVSTPAMAETRPIQPVLDTKTRYTIWTLKTKLKVAEAEKDAALQKGDEWRGYAEEQRKTADKLYSDNISFINVATMLRAENKELKAQTDKDRSTNRTLSADGVRQHRFLALWGVVLALLFLAASLGWFLTARRKISSGLHTVSSRDDQVEKDLATTVVDLRKENTDLRGELTELNRKLNAALDRLKFYNDEPGTPPPAEVTVPEGVRPGARPVEISLDPTPPPVDVERPPGK